MDVLDRLELELKTRSIGSPGAGRGMSGGNFASHVPARASLPSSSLAASPTLVDTAAERLEQKIDLLAQMDFGNATSSSNITQMSQLKLSYEREKRALELAHHAQLVQIQENARHALHRKDQACAEALENVNQLNQGLRKACMAADQRQHELTLQLQTILRRHNEEVARLREHVATAERERDVLVARQSAPAALSEPEAPHAPSHSATADDVHLVASSMADLWATRVQELNAENERLADELLEAKGIARTAVEERKMLQQQFATFRRVSEEQLSLSSAEMSKSTELKEELAARVRGLEQELESVQKKCVDQETINELLEGRVRSLMAAANATKRVDAANTQTATNLTTEQEQEAVRSTPRVTPASRSPPRSMPQPVLQAASARQLPTRLPPPRNL